MGARKPQGRLASLREARERGATLVEAAIALPLLILVLVGILEFGLAFKDWLTVSHSAREGARAGATFGDHPAADFLILTEVGRQLGAASITVQKVRIYNAQTGEGTDYDFTPGSNCEGSECCDWTPCPDPELPSPPYVEPLWDPTTRDITAPDTDTLGVEVEYTHQWITGLFARQSDFASKVEYHLEPQIFS